MDKTKNVSNSLPTKGSNLTEQIYLLMKDCYFPASSTFNEFFKKCVLLEFIQNSGMPLGYRTVKEACKLEDKVVQEALDDLVEEGYLKKVDDSPASFIFPGQEGVGYQLILDVENAETQAENQIAQEAVTPAGEVAQSETETSDLGMEGNTGASAG